MKIKEMSFEEKYDKLYDQYILTDVTAMAFVKEMGLTEKYLDYSIKVYKKMMPMLMGSAFKLIKMLAPGRAFKMFVEGLLENDQVMEPLGNTEITSISDREAVMTTKNSLMLKKYKDIIKKTGLKLDLKEYLELFTEAGKGMAKDFGFDMTMDTTNIEENISTVTIKLKK